MTAIIPDPWHIPLPIDATRVRPATGNDGRLARLAGDDALEPFCTQCDARAGIFTARGSNWLHYTGQPEDNNVEPYETDHTPVIGWRPTPGIVVVAR